MPLRYGLQNRRSGEPSVNPSQENDNEDGYEETDTQGNRVDSQIRQHQIERHEKRKYEKRSNGCAEQEGAKEGNDIRRPQAAANEKNTSNHGEDVETRWVVLPVGYTPYHPTDVENPDNNESNPDNSQW